MSDPDYQPRPVTPPGDARYLLPDGRIQFVGNDGMANLLEELNMTFTTTHPAIVFAGIYEGSSPGFPALISGATPLTALSREVWPEVLRGFEAVRGYTPRAIQIGYSGHGPRDNGKTPPSLYVHRDNPMIGITLTQMVQVLASGHPGGDITHWRQLGVTQNPWAGRRLHVYVQGDLLGFVGGFQARFFPDLALADHCENLGSRTAVVEAVRDDPYGIGLTGWYAARQLTQVVRQLPVSSGAGQPYYGSSADEVAGGHYPLSYPLNLYLAESASQIDPIAYEYCRLALSRPGQEAVARQTPTEEGYLPLSAADLAKQRDLLRSWEQ